MVNTILADSDHAVRTPGLPSLESLASGDTSALARAISALEANVPGIDEQAELRRVADATPALVLGITGIGGSGKSSLTDELTYRLRIDQQDNVGNAVSAIDPARRRGGAALLGDWIRMNSLSDDRVYFRSLATRDCGAEIPAGLADIVAACKVAGFDLVIIESPESVRAIQPSSALVDLSLYVMSAEFGAASQLEKIAMLDCADVAINKFERRGSEDARRDLARQLVRNRGAFVAPLLAVPSDIHL